MIYPGLIALFGRSIDFVPTEGRLCPSEFEQVPKRCDKVLPSHEDLSSALPSLHSQSLPHRLSWEQEEEEAQVQGGQSCIKC